MEKTCFIMMPIADPENYTIGHFKRVYEFIIKPAVVKAGFKPVRADDVLNTNYIAIDVIKKIVSSEMALCDLSSRNPNVFYELGIRQSFNLPITLIRDSITKRAFDIQGFRDVEYDESLRVDNVEAIQAQISETIINTYSNHGNEINSLVSLLGVHPAKLTEGTEISSDTEIILNALDNFGGRLSKIESILSPSRTRTASRFEIIDNQGTWKDISTTEAKELKEGDMIEHAQFGKGVIIAKEGNIHNPVVSVHFQFGESKKLMLNYAKLRKFEKNSS